MWQIWPFQIYFTWNRFILKCSGFVKSYLILWLLLNENCLSIFVLFITCMLARLVYLLINSKSVQVWSLGVQCFQGKFLNQNMISQNQSQPQTSPTFLHFNSTTIQQKTHESKSFVKKLNKAQHWGVEISMKYCLKPNVCHDVLARVPQHAII